mmetsp:Transcript_39026/g.44633  ORF Transcript_39026/g.44633 Transcript_39026/m.44633 type:complete len:96 (+) Transcript_39026:24-311(+)
MNISVYLYGNKNTQKAIWLENHGIDVSSIEQERKEYDSKGAHMKNLLKIAKEKLNSKTNIQMLVEEDFGYAIESIYDLYQLYLLKEAKKSKVILA